MYARLPGEDYPLVWLLEDCWDLEDAKTWGINTDNHRDPIIRELVAEEAYSVIFETIINAYLDAKGP